MEEKNIYATKEEANDALRAMPEIAGVKFCPQINDECRSDCICYQEGSVRDYRDRDAKTGGVTMKFRVINTSCSYSLISNYMEISQ